MTSDQNSSGSTAATVLVCVPRETHRVDGLERIERKHWKPPTAKGSEHSIRGDHAIRFPSSEFSKPTNAANRSAAFITLEVEVGNNARSGQGQVRRICIEEGYARDGASGSRFDTRGSFQPAWVHDALYQCMPMLRLTRCRRRRTEKLTDKGQLTPGDPLFLSLRSLRMDWLHEGFQPLQDGGPLRAASVPTDDPLAAGPNATRGDCVARALAVPAERVPLPQGVCVGHARGGTARRNRFSEKCAGANSAGTAQAPWIISRAVNRNQDPPARSAESRILSARTQ